MTEPTADTSDSQPVDDEGPGWMPAILAGTLVLGMSFFICCGVSTWFLFQQRVEFAVRTLRGSVIPDLEQSLLSPQEKKAVLARLTSLADNLEQGEYSNSQAADVMQRLQKLPLGQWGELAAIESFVANHEDDFPADAIQTLSRLRRGVEQGKVHMLDIIEVLESVSQSDPAASSGRRLQQPLKVEHVKQVISRAAQVADRAEVPDQWFEVSIDAILRREIEKGILSGG